MAKINEEKIKEEIALFKHSIEGQVKFHEVDSFGVVHNIQYFYYFEWARTKYFEHIGIPFTNKTYTAETPIMTVHHEMDYFNPAMLADNYKCLSRVKKVGKSSIVMDNICLHEDGKILCSASVTLVYLSNEDYRPTRIPNEIRDAIKRIEANNVEITE